MTGRVLVVEDDHAICVVMREALEDGGFAVECAQSDREEYSVVPG